MENSLDTLQQKLKVTFKDSSLLLQALTHSSFANENPGFGSNERLEFLGDAVLGLIIGENLYKLCPDFPEGDLTKFRSALVKKDTLSRIARLIELGNYLYLGKGEEASGGRDKSANLAGAMEAVFAAIYLDAGFKQAGKLILRLFKTEMKEVTKHSEVVDYKSQLQDVLQSKYHKPPVYSVLKVTGPDHARQYTVGVTINNKLLGEGSGNSKQSAEVAAARDAIQSLS